MTYEQAHRFLEVEQREMTKIRCNCILKQRMCINPSLSWQKAIQITKGERKMKEDKMIEINDKIYVREEMYGMSYHELDDVRAFVRNHEWDEIPDSIKEYLNKWEDFLIENL